MKEVHFNGCVAHRKYFAVSRWLRSFLKAGTAAVQVLPAAYCSLYIMCYIVWVIISYYLIQFIMKSVVCQVIGMMWRIDGVCVVLFMFKCVCRHIGLFSKMLSLQLFHYSLLSRAQVTIKAVCRLLFKSGNSSWGLSPDKFVQVLQRIKCWHSRKSLTYATELLSQTLNNHPIPIA